MTLTLYGTKGSGSAAVEAALDVAGLAYHSVDAASWQPSAGLDALKKVNPLAQIPTLVLDDGSVLTESAAILLHLGLEHPRSGLVSAGPSRRAQQIRGLIYIAANCYAAIGILDYPDRWYPGPDEAVKAAMQTRGKARLAELWELFADQFAATPWLSGERLGALDILAATVSMWSGARKALAESRPEFTRLLGRIELDPRVAAVWARHWPDRPKAQV
jgi:GST-like protein